MNYWLIGYCSKKGIIQILKYYLKLFFFSKILKFISFEHLLKLTKNIKILKSVVFYQTLRYISNLCIYPQNFSKVAIDPDILQDKFVELVKANDNYATNLLNLNQFDKIPGNEEHQKLNYDEIKSIQNCHKE